MTSHVGRLYALALALVVFFVLWAGIAARPWAATAADPKVAALAAREQQLRREQVIVQKLVARRWAVYRNQLARRKVEIASARRQQLTTVATAPAVRIVNLPPLTITRSS
jgi:hypothetical protein